MTSDREGRQLELIDEFVSAALDAASSHCTRLELRKGCLHRLEALYSEGR
jgi:hypothetical protein